MITRKNKFPIWNISIIIIYFKNRLFTYIVLAVLLFILLTGKVTLLAQLALKIVAGILDIIGKV